jgi:hypothetical protein
MEKLYISVDVETTGPTPGKYSMLSVGACVIGNTEKTFYRELKPISNNFDPTAIRIGCSELEALKDFDLPQYDPNDPGFNPYAVLAILAAKGIEPKQAMTDFAAWIEKVGKGYSVREVAAPIKFDGMFTAWYFDNYLGRNPFGHSGIDINSVYRGVTKDLGRHISDIVVPNPSRHNALEDAIEQAKKFEKILEMMKA